MNHRTVKLLDVLLDDTHHLFNLIYSILIKGKFLCGGFSRLCKREYKIPAVLYRNQLYDVRI